MKRLNVFLFSAALIICFAVFTSCSSNDTSLPEMYVCPVNNMEKLQNDITAYNANFNAQYPQSRSFWKVLRKIAKVLFQDVKGATVSYGTDQKLGKAVVVGVCASLKAVINNNTSNNSGSSGSSGNTGSGSTGSGGDGTCLDRHIDPINELVPEGETGSEAGNLHNTIICNIAQAYDVDTLSDVQMFNAVTQETLAEMGATTEVPSYQSYQSYMNNINALDNDSTSFDQQLTNFVNSGWLPTDQAQIIANYVQQITSLESDAALTQYFTGFATIVRNSNISNDEKSSILVATSVAANSRVLWGNLGEDDTETAE